MIHKQVDTSTDHTQNSPAATRRKKHQAFTATIRQARTHMHMPARLWSVFIHWQPLDFIGSVLANTVARPRAILYGSLFSSIVTLCMYATAKYYGYTLSGAESLASFALGWAVGIIIDYTRLLITGGKQK